MTSAKKAALVGILAALALTAALIERTVCAALPLPPGVRPGLSNIVVTFACAALGFPYALGIAAVKSGFTLLTAGVYAGLLSLAGGLLSVTATALGLRYFHKLSFAGVSVISAVLHNLGQLLAITALTGSGAYLTLAPVLLLSGVGFGLLTGTVLNLVMPALNKIIPFIRKGR